jgi:hypothetical protein
VLNVRWRNSKSIPDEFDVLTAPLVMLKYTLPLEPVEVGPPFQTITAAGTGEAPAITATAIAP